jgi:hypothetical protein
MTGQAGEPLLEIVVEAVLRLGGLKIDEAEDEGAGQAEQRRAEGRAHAAQGRRQARLQIVEHDDHVVAGERQVGDDAADRSDGFQQAPERAEQAEKDQQPRLVAGDVTALVETRADAVEQIAHRQRIERRALATILLAERAGDRRQEPRWCGHREAGAGRAKRLDPRNLGAQHQDAAQSVGDPEQENADDQPVQRRILHECTGDHVVERCHDQQGQQQEQHNADDEAARLGHRRSRLPAARLDALGWSATGRAWARIGNSRLVSPLDRNSRRCSTRNVSRKG